MCDINKMKEKTHVIISIDVEETFDRLHYAFIIRPLSKTRNRRKLPLHYKSHL